MIGVHHSIIPPRIERGQTLGIVAPAGPIKLDKLNAGLARLGDAFALRVADSIVSPRDPAVPSYLAASDERRADELNAMLADPDVRAILLARGGYGLTRILPRFDASALVRDPKPIVGFSDATALLAWAHRNGVRGIHGPMAVQLASLPDGDVAHLIETMTTPRAAGVRPWRLERRAGGGQIRAPLVVGNLTLAATLYGTPWPVPLAGSIALLEDVGERPYELDRYLTQLVLAGELGRARALIAGELTRCVDPQPPSGEPDPDDAALQVVMERARAAGIPCAATAPVGHGDRNEALPFGGDAILDLDAGTLELLDAAVA